MVAQKKFCIICISDSHLLKVEWVFGDEWTEQPEIAALVLVQLLLFSKI